MAKRGAQKRGTASSKPQDPEGEPIVGDLREVEACVRRWSEGDPTAASWLQNLGRDAAVIVARLAEAAGDPSLTAFAKKLAVVPPQVTTNLYALREASVEAVIARAREEAPEPSAAPPFQLSGGALGIFDPRVVKEALVRRGRPRTRPEAVAAGEVLSQGLPVNREIPVQLRADPIPEGQEVVRHRLKVESGVIFAGPPEASDGPRMGTVRLDPFATQLDAFLGKGALFRLAPGVYRLGLYFQAPIVHVHIAPDPDPGASLSQDYQPLPRRAAPGTP